MANIAKGNHTCEISISLYIYLYIYHYRLEFYTVSRPLLETPWSVPMHALLTYLR